MRAIAEIKAAPWLDIADESFDGLMAWYRHPRYNKRGMAIVASWGGGWEHVSASFKNRCPTLDEMCAIKDIFWHDEECVAQYHPPKSVYVNCHPYCLHLWKKAGSEYETPPALFVGLGKGKDAKQ